MYNNNKNNNRYTVCVCPHGSGVVVVTYYSNSSLCFSRARARTQRGHAKATRDLGRVCVVWGRRIYSVWYGQIRTPLPLYLTRSSGSTLREIESQFFFIFFYAKRRVFDIFFSSNQKRNNCDE